MKVLTTKTENETMALGEKIANSVSKGAIFGLIGNLGAGKTKFAQGFAKGLGIKRIINSPTFVLMKVYPMNNKGMLKNFVHIDAYRLKSNEDLENIGAQEYFKRKDTVVLIEWADKIKKVLPPETILIKIQILNNKRKIYY